jgi:hypothetical protein
MQRLFGIRKQPVIGMFRLADNLCMFSESLFKLLFTLSLSQSVYPYLAGQQVEKRGEFGPGFVSEAVFEQPYECLLCQILCISMNAHSMEKVQKRSLMAVHNFDEGILVAISDAPHELSFRYWLARFVSVV